MLRRNVPPPFEAQDFASAKLGPFSGLLSRPELAAAIAKSERTLQRWEALRLGPPVTRVGQTPYYREESIREWLLGNERSTKRRLRR